MECDNLNWSIDFYEANITKCNETLSTLGNFSNIPLLCSNNFHNFKDGDLVRFQGMVQDMLNPEYYYTSYLLCNTQSGEKIRKSGKYRDIAPCQDNEELNFDGKVPGERLVFFCIPMPGQSTWVQNHMNKGATVQSKPAESLSKKRGIDEDTQYQDMSPANNSPDFSGLHKNKKVHDTSVNAASSSNEIQSSDKYFPLDEKGAMAVLVKIYQSEGECNIILNDRIEIIGFLSLNPALESNWDGCDAEDKALNPPPSLVPRIHSIYTRKLNHNNPLLSQNVNSSCEIKASAEKIRSDLHLILTQVLYGDNLAADYIICYLLSRIYSRNNGDALGKFSVNLCNVKYESYGRRLFDLLETIVTNAHYMPLTIEYLNEKSFVPKKDYETNRLWSGKLQLCEDTHLILDETRMNEGKLENTGCLNVAAIQNLIRHQEISYDFSYYPVKYCTNIPVLIISEGKSMFETDIQVKLKPDPSMVETLDETFNAATFFLNGETLERIRIYLTCMRLQEFEMSDELMRKIGNDYVALRQQKSGFNFNDLHNLLVLSRVLALSYGRTTMSADDWSKALEMESERKSRL